MKVSHGGKSPFSEIQESFTNGRISAHICNVTNKAAANFKHSRLMKRFPLQKN